MPAAQARAWPLYVRPPQYTWSSKCFAIFSFTIAPPRGTYPEFTPFAKVMMSGTRPVAVPVVGVARDGAEGLALAPAADEEREPLLDRLRLGDRVGQPV